jgi:hypothetical protein
VQVFRVHGLSFASYPDGQEETSLTSSGAEGPTPWTLAALPYGRFPSGSDEEEQMAALDMQAARPATTAAAAPRRQSAELPEGFWYSVKCRTLGPPLVTEQLKNQRLSRPLALAVLSCDGLSSAAYGTEEILRALLPFFGLAAFSLVLPMTLLILFGVVLVCCPTARWCRCTPRRAARTWWPGRTSARGSPRWPRSRC